jgi:hypothetical protein
MLKLELRKCDAAVREIRETPTFAFSDPCDCVPLSACRNLIRAEYAQFYAANNALAVFVNFLSNPFDLRLQRRAVVPNVFGERDQNITIVSSGNYAIISFLNVCEVHTRQLGGREMPNRSKEARNPDCDRRDTTDPSPLSGFGTSHSNRCREFRRTDRCLRQIS